MSVRKKVVETEKGYEFQYSPSDIRSWNWPTGSSRRESAAPVFRFSHRFGARGQAAVLAMTG